MMRGCLKRKFLIPYILVAIFFLSFSANADNIWKKDKERLKTYKKKMKENEAKIGKIKIEEKSVFNKLKKIQHQLEKRQAELREVIGKKKELVSKIEDIKKEIIKQEEKVDFQKEMLGKRIIALYKLSDMQYLKIIFSSKSYVDMLKRYKYLKLILNQDSDLIKQYINDRRELTQKGETLKKEKEILDEIIKKVKNKEDEVLAERNSKRILLLKVRKEKSYYLKAAKEIDFAAKKLEELILKFQNDATGTKINHKEKFGDFKKVLEPPVNAKIVGFFGKEFVTRLGSYLFNNGIRFSTEIGQDVRTVFSGEVIYSDWFRGYGRMIVISHSDGYYTIYSHLSKLMKRSGDSVKRGDIIAKSGDTGSLSGPSLYFEIRYKGHSLNPLDWLEPMV